MRRERYKGAPAIGVLPLTNWGGIEVLDIDPCGDWIVTCINNGECRIQVRRSKLFWDAESGRTFFRRFNIRYYLDEVIRV